MPMEDVVKQIAQTLEHEGNSRAVFGEAVKLDNKTVIPVAAVRVGGGGGGVRPDGGKTGLVKALFSGGAGGAFDLRPVGFIHEHGGEVVFTAIHLDVRNKPFLTEASSGLGKVIDTVVHAASDFAERKLGPGKHARHS